MTFHQHGGEEIILNLEFWGNGSFHVSVSHRFKSCNHYVRQTFNLSALTASKCPMLTFLLLPCWIFTSSSLFLSCCLILYSYSRFGNALWRERDEWQEPLAFLLLMIWCQMWKSSSLLFHFCELVVRRPLFLLIQVTIGSIYCLL